MKVKYDIKCIFTILYATMPSFSLNILFKFIPADQGCALAQAVTGPLSEEA